MYLKVYWFSKNLIQFSIPVYCSRKNQHKRVVEHVTAAEGLCSDMWAWRKYGQKPIKGSPYPRSYYRCSSSKGCPARKQVERSPLEPGVFIVTYTSEHNHTRPTRRNSLAGSTRSKFPTPKRKNNSPSSSKVLSPTTPLMASIEDEFVQSASLKKEAEQMVQENGNNGTFNMPDMIFDSDLFPSLEDFDELAPEPAMDGCFLDQLLDNFPVPWFLERSTAVSDGHWHEGPSARRHTQAVAVLATDWNCNFIFPSFFSHPFLFCNLESNLAKMAFQARDKVVRLWRM